MWYNTDVHRKSSWFRWSGPQVVIALAAVVVAGVLFYQFVVKANDHLCTRRFLGWEWREKDCNVLDELVN